MNATERRCGRCGQPLAPGASFCRSCGARYEEPAAAPPPQPSPPPEAAVAATVPRPRPQRSLRAALWLGGAIVLAGAGVAVAILLSAGGGSASTTVISRQSQGGTASETEPVTLSAPSGTLEAGRYIQAGSFKFSEDAEAERERLAAAGIAVEVVPSDLAQELYPGFQVLLGGPFSSAAAETQELRQLHRHGVPSAFGRTLRPAQELSSPATVAGAWTGSLERSSSSRPGLDGSLPTSLTLLAGGRRGNLSFGDCSAKLTLAPSTTTVLIYREQSGCDEGGDWQLRLSGEELLLAQLPSDSDLLVLGTLYRGAGE